jgi:pseudouridine-5'-phosphate glycosidase
MVAEEVHIEVEEVCGEAVQEVHEEVVEGGEVLLPEVLSKVASLKLKWCLSTLLLLVEVNAELSQHVEDLLQEDQRTQSNPR